MHILVIHQYYLSAGQPGGSRFNEFARIWSEAGHEVTVLCGALNYTTGVTPEHLQGHTVYEEWDGRVRVLRCRVSGAYTSGYLGRSLAYFGFTASSAWALRSAPKPDVVIATSPPLTTAITGLLASWRWRRRIPWVFEVRDLWPESAVTTGVLTPRSIITRGLYLLEAAAYRSCDSINVLTPAFRKDIVRRGLAPKDKIIFVPNGADVQRFTPGARDNPKRKELGWEDKFVVLYAGAHGRANALRQLVDAAEHLRDHPDILIACVGDGPERQRLQQDAAHRGLSNIRFHPAQPKNEMPEVVNACDVAAAVLQRNPTFKTVYPNKVFDAMACARPVLLAIDGVARELVCHEAKAGVFAEPESGHDIARAVLKLRNDQGRCRAFGASGRAWVLQHATREALAARYLKHLEQLVHNSQKPVGG